MWTKKKLQIVFGILALIVVCLGIWFVIWRQNVSSAVVHVDTPMTENDTADANTQVAAGSAKKNNHKQHGTIYKDPSSPHFMDTSNLLTAIHEQQQSPLYRQDAALQLIHKGDPSIVAHLIQMAGDQTEDLYWRNFCVQLLRIAVDAKRDDAAVSALFTLSGNTDPELSATAIWNLAVLVVPAVGQTRLKDDELQKARQLALSALHDEKKRPRMLQAGIQSCGRLGLRDALPDLRRMAADESDPALSQLALAALGELRDSESRPLLESALTSTNPRRAQVARTALGMLK
jgi:HEAT repeat protein